MNRWLLLVLVLILGVFLGRRSTIVFKNLSMIGALTVKESVDTVHVKKAYGYTDNKAYAIYLPFHENDMNRYKIVMFGDSHIAGVDWKVMLGRNDVANRGIPGDVSEGLMPRINTVLNCKPELCIVEIGINDIFRGISKEQYLNNVSTVLDTLNAESIKPVCVSIIPLGSSGDSTNITINEQIYDFNEALEMLVTDKGGVFLDIRTGLCSNGTTDPEYQIFDKLHLSYAGYRVWAGRLLEIIQ